MILDIMNNPEMIGRQEVCWPYENRRDLGSSRLLLMGVLG